MRSSRSPHRYRLLGWAALAAFVAGVSNTGGLIILPYFIVRFVFFTGLAIYRRIEKTLFPARVAAAAEAAAVIAALPSEPNWDEFGSGERRAVTSAMRKAIAMYGAPAASLDGLSFEQKPSHYHGAKADILVYDGAGRPVLRGRRAQDGRFAFWKAPA